MDVYFRKGLTPDFVVEFTTKEYLEKKIRKWRKQ